MMSAINLHAVAQLSTERMLNCIVEGMAIALFAWLLLRIMSLRNSGHQNSGTRFAVWFAALFAVAALPLVRALPGSAMNPTGIAHPAVMVPGSWATYLFLLWASLVTLGLLRVGLGLWHVRQVRKNCVEIDTASLDPALQATLKEFRSVRSVKICVSDSLQVPTAIGFVRPVVALPAWTLRELSSTELNAILLHELAHLRRWDDWTNLAQKLLRAVFFFHPAVWWIEGKLSLEREMACDDAVLAETANPRAYAQCLVAVAEKSLVHRGLAMAQAAVSRVRQTTQRVTQILDTNRPGATRVWKPALGMVAAFAMVCIGLSSRSPELVSFQDKDQDRAMIAAADSAPMSGSAPNPGLSMAVVQPAKLVSLKRSNHVVPASPARTVLAKTMTSPQEFETSDAVEAKLESRPAKAVLVPTSFTGTNEIGVTETSKQQQPPRLKSVVLVYQGLQYDDAGFAHWTICVWRVTVPVQQPALATNPAKST
jgi:beta-lactamase regulating signal transducer with metallopeptidase domain